MTTQLDATNFINFIHVSTILCGGERQLTVAIRRGRKYRHYFANASDCVRLTRVLGWTVSLKPGLVFSEHGVGLIYSDGGERIR